MKIYIGNMPYTITSEELSGLFGEYGSVEDATVITDRETGRSKGFGFVDMPNNSEADRAIKALNSTPTQWPHDHRQSGSPTRGSSAASLILAAVTAVELQGRRETAPRPVHR